MKIRIKNQPDFLSGIAFAAIGAGFVAAARWYEFGTGAQMGPAQFPVIVGALLALFGMVIAARSVSAVASEERVEPVSVYPLVVVLGAVAFFAVLLQPFGLVLATVALVLISAVASHEFGWRYAVLTAAVLTLGSYLIFVLGLGLPMPVLPGGF